MSKSTRKAKLNAQRSRSGSPDESLGAVAQDVSQDADVERPDGSSGPSRWVRRCISAALLIHLTAIFAPPLNFATRGSGPQAWVYQWLRPYSQAAYLDHGYFFFAPDPGSSHLVRYRAEFDDDRVPVEDMFPDKRKQWPRLLYHRHFMLTEHLHAAYVPPVAPPNLSDADQASWRSARDLYEARWSGFEEHLKTQLGASRLQMYRVEHRPPDPIEFAEGGVRLDAAELYRDLSEVEVEEVAPPTEAVGPLGPAPMRPRANPVDRLGPFGPVSPATPLRPATPMRPLVPDQRPPAAPLESLDSPEDGGSP